MLEPTKLAQITRESSKYINSFRPEKEKVEREGRAEKSGDLEDSTHDRAKRTPSVMKIDGCEGSGHTLTRPAGNVDSFCTVILRLVGVKVYIDNVERICR